MDNSDERIENMIKLAQKIKSSGIKYDDIRNRDWMNKQSDVSDILKKLIEIENLLINLDDYNTDNDLDYDYIEDFMLQIGEIRNEFTKYVDENKELTNIKIN